MGKNQYLAISVIRAVQKDGFLPFFSEVAYRAGINDQRLYKAIRATLKVVLGATFVDDDE